MRQLLNGSLNMHQIDTFNFKMCKIFFRGEHAIITIVSWNPVENIALIRIVNSMLTNNEMLYKPFIKHLF